MTGDRATHIDRWFHAASDPNGSCWQSLHAGSIPLPVHNACEAQLFWHMKPCLSGLDRQDTARARSAHLGSLSQLLLYLGKGSKLPARKLRMQPVRSGDASCPCLSAAALQPSRRTTRGFVVTACKRDVATATGYQMDCVDCG